MAGIKAQIKGEENAIAAAMIETLFDVYGLQAADQLFFHEAAWKSKESTDDWAIGKDIVLQHPAAAHGRFRGRRQRTGGDLRRGRQARKR